MHLCVVFTRAKRCAFLCGLCAMCCVCCMLCVAGFAPCGASCVMYVARSTSCVVRVAMCAVSVLYVFGVLRLVGDLVRVVLCGVCVVC